MKSITQKFILLLVPVLLMGVGLSAASFNVVNTGAWSDCNTWNLTMGCTTPSNGDDISFMFSETLTLDSDVTVRHIDIDGNSGAVIDLNGFTLTITGQLDLSSSAGAGVITDGSVSQTGKVRFTGGEDRDGAGDNTIIIDSRRAHGFPWALEIELDNPTDAVNTESSFSSFSHLACGSLNLIQGQLQIGTDPSNMLNALVLSQAANGDGSITIGSNASLNTARIGQRASATGSPEDGTWINDITVDGRLELRVSGDNSNGALNAETITINGTLAMYGSGSLASQGGTNAIVYGANATLEYNNNTSSSDAGFGHELSRNGGSTAEVPNIIVNITDASNNLNTFARDVIVTNDITFINGRIDFSSSTDKITLRPAATITGAGLATGYFVWDWNDFITSNPDGGVEKEDIANGASFTFPVGLSADYNGGNASYNPITITNQDASAETFRVAADNTVKSPVDATKVVNIEYWITTADGNGNIDVTIDITGATRGTNFDIGTTDLYKYDGTAWQPLSNPNAMGNIFSGSWDGPLSPFAAGSAGSLPVELLSFTAKEEGRANVLQWETASETHNLGFDVEHSTDGKNFEKIGFVEGWGTTTEKQAYRFEHLTAQAVSYYRLRQVDFDGQYEYSEVVMLERTAQSSTKLYPNPAMSGEEAYLGLELPYASDLEVQILDVTGRMVAHFQKELEAGQHELPLQSFIRQGNTSLYYVKTIVNGKVTTHILSLR